MPLKNYRWFIEYFGAEEGHLHGIREVLFSKQTPFQSMDILQLGSYGKSLVLDGRIQSTVLMPASIPHAVNAPRRFKMLLTMIRG